MISLHQCETHSLSSITSTHLAANQSRSLDQSSNSNYSNSSIIHSLSFSSSLFNSFDISKSSSSICSLYFLLYCEFKYSTICLSLISLLILSLSQFWSSSVFDRKYQRFFAITFQLSSLKVYLQELVCFILSIVFN